MRAFYAKTAGILLAVAVMFALVGAYNSTTDTQQGNPGLAMELIEKNERLDALEAANKVPPSLPPAAQDGQLSSEAYKNVRVLGHITTGEMTRLMTSMVLWVAPQQGCAYCHAPLRDAAGKVVVDSAGNPQVDANNLHSDEVYAKVVARRMLQMTMAINSGWKSHVKETGVTCYTCHRGNPVPTNIWYDQPEDARSGTLLGEKANQNTPAAVAGLTSLPTNALRTYLVDDNPIRVISTQALPIDNRTSIKETEWTYGLMMHMSSALGVNCTHCHNTRSMADWDSSPPQRAQAWYGIRMVRQLNTGYLEPLVNVLPPARLGELGDAPKLNCTTCHQGAYKPLLGASMLKDHPALASPGPTAPPTL